MHTRMQELEMAKRVWAQAIEHLERKIAAVSESGARDVEENDGDEDEREPDARRWRWEHQITIYQMCIDWAMQQQDVLEFREDAEQALQRERFYRLMAVLAKAELDRDDHLHSAALVASSTTQHMSNQQAVEDLQRTASAALLCLVPHFAEKVPKAA